VDLVAFLEKKLGEIGAVLAGDSSDKSFFHIFVPVGSDPSKCLIS
jgi:hypothetical protein